MQVKKQEQEETPWWMPAGITLADVIAAYKPLGASTEASSRINLANPGQHDLEKIGNPAWTAAAGWAIPAVINAGYYASGIATFASMFVKYSDVPTGRNVSGQACGCAMSSNRNFFLRTVHPQSDGNFYDSTPGFLTTTKTYNPMQPLHFNGDYAYFYPSGVLGLSENTVYFNGGTASDPGWGMGALSNYYSVALNHNYLKIGNFLVLNAAVSWAAYKIQAICFYSTTLSAAQILELCASMAGL